MNALRLLAAGLALGAVTAMPALAGAQALTADEIDSAIKAGSAGAVSSITCTTNGAVLSSESRPFTITVSGPFTRVMRAAADAKKKYQAFTAADVTSDMAAPTVVLVASPHAPKMERGGWKRAPLAEHLVLKRMGVRIPGPADVLQPTSVEPVDAEWGNALGGRFEGRGLIATFDLETFRNAPAGTFEAVLITSAGERRCIPPIKQRATFR